MFDNQTHKKFRVQFCSIPEHNRLNDCIQLSPIVFNCKFVPFCLIGFTGICTNVRPASVYQTSDDVTYIFGASDMC